MKAFTFFILSLTILFTTPPKTIPRDMLNAFTENGKIKVDHWYIDGSKSSNPKDYIWTKKQIDKLVINADQRKTSYYCETDTYLYYALDKHIDHIKGKEIAIIGSLTPWYESIILSYGGIPTTIEYNTISCDDKRITTYTVEEFEHIDKKFDAIISISSIEHSGLGRYGDDLDPYGDYKAMNSFKDLLKPNGLIFLAVPVGQDRITFNAHRVYGKIRLKKLLTGWSVIDSFGYSQKDLKIKRFTHQPVFVLTQN